MNTGNRSGRPDDHSRMTCQRCRDAVSALLDGEQLPEDDFVVRNHLPRCAACRAAARRAREITLLARSWRSEALPDASPDLLATLLAAPTDPFVGSRADGDSGGRAGAGPSCAVDHGHLQAGRERGVRMRSRLPVWLPGGQAVPLRARGSLRTCWTPIGPRRGCTRGRDGRAASAWGCSRSLPARWPSGWATPGSTPASGSTWRRSACGSSSADCTSRPGWAPPWPWGCCSTRLSWCPRSLRARWTSTATGPSAARAGPRASLRCRACFWPRRPRLT